MMSRWVGLHHIIWISNSCPFRFGIRFQRLKLDLGIGCDEWIHLLMKFDFDCRKVHQFTFSWTFLSCNRIEFQSFYKYITYHLILWLWIDCKMHLWYQFLFLRWTLHCIWQSIHIYAMPVLNFIWNWLTSNCYHDILYILTFD